MWIGEWKIRDGLSGLSTGCEKCDIQSRYAKDIEGAGRVRMRTFGG